MQKRSKVLYKMSKKYNTINDTILADNVSNGEKVLGQALSKLCPRSRKFIIIKEYQVPELIGFNHLWVRSPRYDYAIVNKNEEPIMFFEFDGLQHYDVKGYATQDNFFTIVERDNAKNAYAFYKCIPLVRLPYGLLQYSENEIEEFIYQVAYTYLSAAVYSDKPQSEDIEVIKERFMNRVKINKIPPKTKKTHWIVRVRDGKRYSDYQSAAKDNDCSASQIRKAIDNRSQIAKSYWKREAIAIEIEVKE